MPMCKYRTVAGIFLTILLAGLINFEDVYAGINSKLCSSECEPPSLGLDVTGSRQYVDNGFGINGKFYDVNYFSQIIPTQNFTVGETVNIKLKIFENSGPQYLEYVGLSIVLDEPLILGGMLVEEYESTIAWTKKFDGTKSIDTNDPYDLIDVINVTDSLEDNRTILDYEFIITKPIESKTIKVEMWDYKRNSWNNHFYEAITVTENHSKLVIPLENEIITLDTENIDKSKLPEWVQKIFSWYYEGEIDKKQLAQTLEFLIKQGIIPK